MADITEAESLGPLRNLPSSNFPVQTDDSQKPRDKVWRRYCGLGQARRIPLPLKGQPSKARFAARLLKIACKRSGEIARLNQTLGRLHDAKRVSIENWRSSVKGKSDKVGASQLLKTSTRTTPHLTRPCQDAIFGKKPRLISRHEPRSSAATRPTPSL